MTDAILTLKLESRLMFGWIFMNYYDVWNIYNAITASWVATNYGEISSLVVLFEWILRTFWMCSWETSSWSQRPALTCLGAGRSRIVPLDWALKMDLFSRGFHGTACLLISMLTSGKLSKYEVSSIEATLTVMAAGLSLRLLQSIFFIQPNFFISSRLDTLRSSDVSKLQRHPAIRCHVRRQKLSN